MKQLSLQLTFENPTPEVLRNLATLVEMSDDSAIAGTLPLHTDGAASDRSLPAPDAAIRKTMRKLVGSIVIVHKREWHDVWVSAYHEFFKTTGRHPVVESARLCLDSHLDYVFTRPLWPSVLIHILENTLTGKEGNS